ncbi:MAG: lytic transglycosylase domain-containing protein [Candidatus Acidiferrales bacterium]
MTKRTISVTLLALGIGLSVSMPARAQIASQVDESGKLVFVNSEPAGHSPHRSAPPGFHSAKSNEFASNSEAGTTAEVIPPDRLERIVRDASARHNLDPALVKAVIGVESNWNPAAVSRKGALGLMQLIPTTAGRFGVGNAFDPAQNVEGGTSYLRSLLDRYHGDLELTLAAYNAGPGAVERSGGIPNIPETRSYVQKVTETYFRPDSGRDPSFAGPRRTRIRQDVDDNGRVVFTNE